MNPLCISAPAIAPLAPTSAPFTQTELLWLVTLCTKDRAPWFGEIRDHRMHPSTVGNIVTHHWHAIPYHTPGARCEAFCLLPNHIHAMLVTPSTWHEGDVREILAKFRETCTAQIHKSFATDFDWQPRSAVQPIRHVDDAFRARRMISLNVVAWEEDALNV